MSAPTARSVTGSNIAKPSTRPTSGALGRIDRSRVWEEAMDVGVFGLGAMGRGIAGSLLKAGHRVRVWNRSPGPVDALVAQGAHRCADAREVTQGAALVTMLANDAAYREAFVAGGVLDAM